MELIILLRGLSTLFSYQGQSSTSTMLDKLATLVEAGGNVDRYMGEVAEAMKSGTEATMADITNRIESEVDEFLSRGEDGKVEDTSQPE